MSLGDRLVELLSEQRARASLVPMAAAAGSQPHLVQLSTSQDWIDLADRFADSDNSNVKPWRRCLDVLQGLGAQCVVIETYYACLDYRSEFAAFYANLDASRYNATIRLHFFERSLDADNISNLSEQERAAYLGYVVLRESDAPPVGRTVIRTPSYITTAADIREPVHFFGQRLEVVGVPFMQQDARFATCAHVSTWALLYTAYRRGVSARQFIADVVERAGPLRPLRPGSPIGLTRDEVFTIIAELGLGAFTYSFPQFDDPGKQLPRLSLEQLSAPRQRRLSELFAAELAERRRVPEGEEPVADRDISVSKLVLPQVSELLRGSAVDDEGVELSPEDRSAEAFDLLVSELVQPYLESGWPLYLYTLDHALVLLGIDGQEDGRGLFFVHDDQNGPYLAAESLLTLSRESLSAQVSETGSAPRDARAEHHAAGTVLPFSRYDSTDLRVQGLVAGVPPRVLLPLSAAQDRALLFATSAERPVDRVSTSLMMGIDLKARRRAEFLGQTVNLSEEERPAVRDAAGLQALSSAHFAEWVVLVQGLTESGDAVWEAAFDASSSQYAPKCQYLRLGTWACFEQRRSATRAVAVRLQRQTFPAIPVPLRVGKS